MNTLLQFLFYAQNRLIRLPMQRKFFTFVTPPHLNSPHFKVGESFLIILNFSRGNIVFSKIAHNDVNHSFSYWLVILVTFVVVTIRHYEPLTSHDQT